MIIGVYISQQIFAISMLRAFKLSLEHDCKPACIFTSNFQELFAITSRGILLQLSPCIMCVQYIGGCSVHRGVFSTSGGYHEYIGGISWVHRGISWVHRGMFSTSGGYHDECGGISWWMWGIPWVHRGMFSTSEGYHEYIRGISWVHRGTFSTSEGYHDTCGGATW